MDAFFLYNILERRIASKRLAMPKFPLAERYHRIYIAWDTFGWKL